MAGREYGAAFSRLFSARVIRELATTGRSPLAKSVLTECRADAFSRSLTLAEWFDGLHAVLFKHYRSEYFYKNMIARRILLGRHSLRSSTMLMEFRAGNAKADCVILNGTSNVYEIKSEFDSTARMKRQIEAYRTVFDCIHVVTTRNLVDTVAAEVDDAIGLLVLNDRHSMTTVRKPRSLKSQVDPLVIFDSLRQEEYVSAIRNTFGTVPSVPNTRLYGACRELFAELSPEEAHDAMVGVLKMRGSSLGLQRFVTAVPASLKAAALAVGALSKEHQDRFIGLLHSSAHHCLLSA